MRDPSCLNLGQNRCCNMITSQLYDRRALDTPPSLALVSTLAHLNYLTSASPPIREIVTQDGAIERLAKILEWTLTPQALDVLRNGMRETESMAAAASSSSSGFKGKERERVTSSMDVDDTTPVAPRPVRGELITGDEDLVDFLRPSTSAKAPPPPPQPPARRTLRHPHKPFKLFSSFTTPNSSSSSSSISSPSMSLTSSFIIASHSASVSAPQTTQVLAPAPAPQSPYRPPLSLTPRLPTLNAVVDPSLALGSPGPITIAGSEEVDGDVVDAAPVQAPVAPVPVQVPVPVPTLIGSASPSVTTGFAHPEWAKGHRELIYLRTLSLQCIVNVGVRGSETIRTRVVESGVLPVITKVLESFMMHYDARRRADAERQSALFKTYPVHHPHHHHPHHHYHHVNEGQARAAMQVVQALHAAPRPQSQINTVVAPLIQVDIPAPRPRSVIPNSASSSSLSVPAAVAGTTTAPPSRTVTPDHISSSSGEEAEMDEEPLDYDSAEGEREAKGIDKIIIDVIKQDEDDVGAQAEGDDMQVDAVPQPTRHLSRRSVDGVAVGRRTSGSTHSIPHSSPQTTLVPSAPPPPTTTNVVEDLAAAFAVSVPASGASTPTSDADVPTLGETAASRHLYPHRPDVPEPADDPFGCSEEQVLMALQLLAYLSKYPTLRVAFHYPGAELKLFNLDKDRDLLPTEMRAEDVGAEWRARMLEREKERKAGGTGRTLMGSGGAWGAKAGEGHPVLQHHVQHHHHHHHHHHQKTGRHGKHHHHHPSDATVVPSSSSHSAIPTLPNVFSVVERFTHRPSPSSIHPGASKSLVPRIPEEVGYWAGVIMRNACRKDERSGGVRQCANMLCGKWETFPREFAKCRRCRKAKYCSKGCQSRAWSMGHKYWCSSKDVEMPLPAVAPAQQAAAAGAGAQGQSVLQLGQRRMALAAAVPVEVDGDASDGEDML